MRSFGTLRTQNPTRGRLSAWICASALLVAGFAVAAFGSGTASATADETEKHPDFRGLYQDGTLRIVVDGDVRTSSEVWRKGNTVLIRSKALDKPLLVHGRGRSKKVESIRFSDVQYEKDGAAWLKHDFKAETCCVPERKRDAEGNAVIAFVFEGKKIEIVGNPYMLGKADLDKLLEHSPQYSRTKGTWKLDDSAVGALKKLQPFTLRVYFGSWCGRCATLMPRIVALERALGKKVEVEYVGLKDKFGKKGKWELQADADKAHDMPTVLVRRGDKPLGRLDHAQLERDPASELLQLLNGGA